MTDNENDPYGPSAAATLIEQVRAARNLSVRRAAELAGLSEGRWRQIAKGYQQVTKDVRVPVNAPPDTVAKMARAVGLTPGDLEPTGSPEVVESLRVFLQADNGRNVTYDVERWERALEIMQGWIDSDYEHLHPPTETLWLYSPTQLAAALAEHVERLEHIQADMDQAHFTARRAASTRQEDQREPRDAAPMTQAGASPATTDLDGAGPRVGEVTPSRAPDMPPPATSPQPTRGRRGTSLHE